MIGSFICFLIALIIRITIGSLIGQFEFLSEWLPWLTGIVIALAIIFVIFVIAKLINVIKSKKK